MPTEDTAESRLAKTLFVVEANSFEQLALWKDYAKESKEAQYPKPVTWEQMHGWLIQVGKIGKRPCCISATWVKINGQLVMFYDQCSQVTDSKQTEKWIKKYFKKKWDKGTRESFTNASNFHHCIDAINEANKEKENA